MYHKQAQDIESYDYQSENTVNMNPDFLSFLSENQQINPPKCSHTKVNGYDPFEKVVLIKGIDNQILTSFRTLKGDNNTVSDTMKIIHRKFISSKSSNRFKNT